MNQLLNDRLKIAYVFGDSTKSFTLKNGYAYILVSNFHPLNGGDTGLVLLITYQDRVFLTHELIGTMYKSNFTSSGLTITRNSSILFRGFLIELSSW